MINAILGTKSHMRQGFTTQGNRVVISLVNTDGNFVAQIKTQDKEGYSALQLAHGSIKTKSKSKPFLGHLKKANIQTTNTAPRFTREVRFSNQEAADSGQIKVGDKVVVSDVLKPGDLVRVTGVSKGKGFQGVVKRHNFAGGPKTHGQSDRHRAPGSIGQGTTPGRVYKGKRMAGRMGGETSTVRNLTVLKIDNDMLWLSGPIPGANKNLVVIEKIGENTKFQELYSEEVKQDNIEIQTPEEIQTESPQIEEPAQTKESEQTEVASSDTNK